jgi:hypothetical protein
LLRCFAHKAQHAESATLQRGIDGFKRMGPFRVYLKGRSGQLWLMGRLFFFIIFFGAADENKATGH